MPSDTPKRILRGAKLATITVRRPSRASGEYAERMPEKTLRVSPPKSRVSCNSLSAPSTYCALAIRAMRRSTLANSSKLISSAIGSSASGPFGVFFSFCSSTRSSFDASIMASILSRSTRVISGLNLLIGWLSSTLPRLSQSRVSIFINSRACSAMVGTTGARYTMSWRNRLIPTEQISSTS